MLMRRLLALAALTCLACAQPHRQLTPESSRSTVTRYHGVVIVEVRGSIDPSSHILRASVDSVWSVLQGVYSDLEIEVSAVDAKAYQLGNTRFDPRRIGGKRLSSYLRCGYGVGHANNADTYRVTMSMVTSVRVDDQKQTVLQTEITAKATPRMVSGDPVMCTSTGGLERRIAEMVWERLGGS